ncbi:MAG: hypothetical protein ACHQ49_17740 [Elusimicrobiota bacterium]
MMKNSTAVRLLGFSLAVSLVLCLPAFLMPLQRGFFAKRFPAEFSAWTNNGSFSYLDSFHMAEDQYTYAARIQHAGSHLLPGDAYIRENHSPRLLVRDFIPFYALGWVYRLVGDMPRAWVAIHLLLTFLWVPCLYLFLRRMGAKSEAALFIAVTSTLFNDMTRLLVSGGPVAMAKDAAQYFFWLLGSYIYWPGPTRLLRPLFTYPCLFLAGAAFAWLDSKRSRAAVLVSGAAGGALLYVHPDVFGFYAGAGVLFTAYSLWRERARALPLLASLAISGLVCLPWLAINASSSSEELDMMGRIYGRMPEWGSVLYLACAASCWRLLRSERLALWTACGLITLVLAVNSQIVIGWQTNHATWFYLANTIVALLLAVDWSRRLRVKTESWLWLAACAVLLAAPRALSYSVQHYKIYALPRYEEDALRWLNQNTPQDSVVVALSPMTNFHLPSHTHDKIMIARLFLLTSDLSVKENAERVNFALSLYGVAPRTFMKEGMDASGQWERKLWSGEADAASRERSGALLGYFDVIAPDRMLDLLETTGREAPGAKFPADYLWVGPFEKSVAPDFADRARRSGWETVFENPDVTLYRLPVAR